MKRMFYALIFILLVTSSDVYSVWGAARSQPTALFSGKAVLASMALGLGALTWYRYTIGNPRKQKAARSGQSQALRAQLPVVREEIAVAAVTLSSLVALSKSRLINKLLPNVFSYVQKMGSSTKIVAAALGGLITGYLLRGQMPKKVQYNLSAQNEVQSSRESRFIALLERAIDDDQRNYSAVIAALVKDQKGLRDLLTNNDFGYLTRLTEYKNAKEQRLNTASELREKLQATVKDIELYLQVLPLGIPFSKK